MTPLEEFLSRLKNVRETGIKQWDAQCPAHDDGHNSLCISEGDDGRVLIKCQAGCVTAEVVHAVGMMMRDLFPTHGMSERDKSKPKGNIVAKYDYYDQFGALLYQVVRMDPKDFRQRRPDGGKGWIWNLKGIDRVLYRLPELMKADKSQVRICVEGEKDADRLAALGFVVTTCCGGAGKWKKEYVKHLIDCDVVILPDNDQPGFDHARHVVASLTGIARSVKVITLPHLPPKGDVSDWLNNGGTKESLLEIIGGAPTHDPGKPSEAEAAATAAKQARDQEKIDPASTHFEEQILKDLQLDVLGEVEGSNGNIKVFSEAMRKTDIIKDVGKMTIERLTQICGPIVKSKVHKGAEDIEGMYRISEVRCAISLMSSFRRLGNESEVGPGCWRGQSVDGKQETDSIVLVGAGEAAKWDGEKLEKIAKPKVDGLLLDLGASDPWYSFDDLSAMVAACDHDWALAATKEAEALFNRWRWRTEESPLVVIGLILATWIQTIWPWRPQVAIIGKSNTGKSMLFEALAGIFGRLAVRSSQSTAAGIRQSVRQSATVIMADEFESGRFRNDILEMLRASSRGDKVLRGTSGQKGNEFVLRHIGWIAAIESGLRREPDKNRFVTLELIPPLKENAGKLALPPMRDLATLGQKLLAVSVRYSLAAASLAVDLKSRRFDGFTPRVIESYAVPAAIVAAMLGANDDAAAGILHRMLLTVDTSDAAEGDEAALLSDIMESIIEVERGERASVAQVIAMLNTNQHADDALARVGLAVFANQDDMLFGKLLLGDYLFVCHRAVRRHLLRGTPWEQQNIDQILCRVDGAVKARKYMAGGHPWGVMIPLKAATQ